MGEWIKREIYQWGMVILVVIVLRAIFVEAYVIPTGSMEKTLLIGDALLVNRFIYGIKLPVPFSGDQIPIIPGREPRRGEIVVFQYPYENRNFVKRCVARAGDTVAVIDKVLYINGQRINEPYVWYKDSRVYRSIKYDPVLYQQKWENAELAEILGLHVRDNFGPVVVPDDHIFVMGDSRDNSADSRFWGPLHVKYLKGQPLFIYFSFDPGREAQNLWDILRVWEWKAVRLSRIGRVT
ncbi:signal peptidase I [candidate division WOR-3 bacterium]|nr:signal peptidase I [candidate division WOR-3 bacterium]